MTHQLPIDRTLEIRIAEAASDYKLGLENEGFANEFGGIDKLRAELFLLVTEWEGDADEECGL